MPRDLFKREALVSASKGALSSSYKGGSLPERCPPEDAINAPDGHLLRLVAQNPCTADDFRSGHAEGKKQPKKCDMCVWMAYSFWVETTPKEKLADLAKLPNLRDKKFIAVVKVNASCGMVKPHQDKEHLSFWMRDSFEPEKAVADAIPL
jgi:hypothetical protein